MKSVLQQLYNGEIDPAARFSPKEKEFRKIYQKYYKDYDDFVEILSKLNPPLDQRFIEIMDEQFGRTPQEFYAMFIGGFRLGAKMMAEIFQYGQPAGESYE